MRWGDSACTMHDEFHRAEWDLKDIDLYSRVTVMLDDAKIQERRDEVRQEAQYLGNAND